MKPDARYKIWDSPLTDAQVRWGSDNEKEAERMCHKLNMTNKRIRGPWGYGRYWIEDAGDNRRTL